MLFSKKITITLIFILMLVLGSCSYNKNLIEYCPIEHTGCQGNSYYLYWLKYHKQYDNKPTDNFPPEAKTEEKDVRNCPITRKGCQGNHFRYFYDKHHKEIGVY